MKEQLKTELAKIDEIIKDANNRRKELIASYIEKTAKFKVGDKVKCDSQIGFIAKVEYKGYSNSSISYQVNKQKKDGTMSSHVLRYYVSDKNISLT